MATSASRSSFCSKSLVGAEVSAIAVALIPLFCGRGAVRWQRGGFPAGRRRTPPRPSPPAEPKPRPAVRSRSPAAAIRRPPAPACAAGISRRYTSSPVGPAYSACCGSYSRTCASSNSPVATYGGFETTMSNRSPRTAPSRSDSAAAPVPPRHAAPHFRAPPPAPPATCPPPSPQPAANGAPAPQQSRPIPSPHRKSAPRCSRSTRVSAASTRCSVSGRGISTSGVTFSASP